MLPQFQIFGLEVSTYFLTISLIFTALVPFVVRRAEKLKLSASKALDLYLLVLLGAFLGSRIFYILYQEPHFYLSNPEQIFYFWNGGFVFFGGLIGAVLLGYLYCKRINEDPELWLNFSIPLLSFGYAFGRLACLLNGCCFGEKSNLPWAVFMHQAYRHPTQVYAILFELLVFAVLLYVESKKGFRSFLMLPVWLCLHPIGRLLMEHFRADDRGGELLGVSVSSLISLMLLLTGLVMTYKKIRWTHQVSDS